MFLPKISGIGDMSFQAALLFVNKKLASLPAISNPTMEAHIVTKYVIVLITLDLPTRDLVYV
jgi:hypothetical protein